LGEILFNMLIDSFELFFQDFSIVGIVFTIDCPKLGTVYIFSTTLNNLVISIIPYFIVPQALL